MAAMNMNMYEYMHRPMLQQQQQSVDARMSGTPCSDRASDQEDLDERRRMKNRERVRKCRKRKQDRLNFLEDRTAELEKENGLLKAKVARKASGVKDHEPLTDVQLDELRKSQTTTLLAYIRAYNEAAEGATFDMNACSIWTDNAEILYGSSGTSVTGLAGIIACKKSSSSVFAKYDIKQYMVQWKPNSTDKCLVNWDIEVIVKQDAAKDVPLTAPFADVAPHFGATGEVLTFQMTSHITFEGAKIVEEIRQLNLSRISEKALEQFGDDPKKAADVLRSLMKTA
uniref:BZIP domain-containing protein n=1 Tax=Hyaloperonospora arabidopsidis (strain Emoy2) TaxID=559515 RepID=M4B159_HYAAE